MLVVILIKFFIYHTTSHGCSISLHKKWNVNNNVNKKKNKWKNENAHIQGIHTKELKNQAKINEWKIDKIKKIEINKMRWQKIIKRWAQHKKKERCVERMNNKSNFAVNQKKKNK